MISNKKTLQLVYVAIISLCLYGLVTLQYSRRFHFNWSGFSCIGERFATHINHHDLWIFKNSYGYDGQFYYFMSEDLFLNQSHHPEIDVPHYRYQRILYPLFAKAFSLNGTLNIHIMPILVNISAITLTTLLFALMLMKSKKNPFFSLLYPLSGGLFMCLFRNLAAPLSILFLISSLFSYDRKKIIPTVFFLSLLFLTKETFIIILPVFMIHALLNKAPLKKAALLSLSILPWGIWEFYIFLKLKVVPFHGGRNNFSVPFLDFMNYYSKLSNLNIRVEEKILAFTFLLLLASMTIMIFWQTLKKVELHHVLYWVLFLLMMSLSNRVWVDPYSYIRLSLPLFALFIYSFIHKPSKWVIVPACLNISLLFVVFWWEKVIC